VRLALAKNWKELGGGVHVWVARLDCDESALRELEVTLSPDEISRAARFHFAEDRNHYVIARGVLRELLGRYLLQAPEGVRFSYGPRGKPFIMGSEGNLCFNVSHSGDLAVYAIARERNLGIDVEQIAPDSAGEDIARRYFSAREIQDLQGLDAADRVQGFFRCWTRKEAYLKATGMGLHTPLDSFSVSILPGEPARFLGGVEPGWQLAAYDPGEGYAAALVYDGGPSSVEIFRAES
jgi:4'-phosphopantetheinyl transferase